MKIWKLVGFKSGLGSHAKQTQTMKSTSATLKLPRFPLEQRHRRRHPSHHLIQRASAQTRHHTVNHIAGVPHHHNSILQTRVQQPDHASPVPKFSSRATRGVEDLVDPQFHGAHGLWRFDAND